MQLHTKEETKRVSERGEKEKGTERSERKKGQRQQRGTQMERKREQETRRLALKAERDVVERTIE